LASASDNAQHVAGFKQAVAQKVSFCHVDHLLGGQRLVAAHGLDSPEKVGAAGHGLNMGKGVNDRRRTVFGNHAGGVTAFGLSLIHISEPTRPLYISYAVF